MNIYAKLPNGKKVRHGALVKDDFVRTIDSSYIRWSDEAFTVNSSVLPTLKEHGCKKLVFIYMGASSQVTYEVLLEKALAVGTMKTNEHGEENLRIPMKACKVVGEVNYKEVEKIFSDPVEDNSPKQSNLF